MGHQRFDRGATVIDYFQDVNAVVQTALLEDIGAGDLTARLVPADTLATATVIARETAVLCGSRWFEATYRCIDPSIKINWHHTDRDVLAPEQMVCTITGNARTIVTGERTALNFLQTLSGTATLTAQYVARLKDSNTRLLDTRKTIPGLRRAQKYAVHCGGGFNHRAGLYDGVLIKENHIAAAGSVTAAIIRMQQTGSAVPIEVEVERVAQIEEAIAAGADMLLLDNFSFDAMRQAVAVTNGRVQLEASGGFGFDDLAAVAATGVDFVSVGALTKHLRATDYSMRIINR
ncbi:MAG: carboxylating nicotinate-nucleotide diphosphorylase [Gammaproteobacteria bacterium]|nr:carboxylating nicotinate-nucleotide diphosphorylase [Gammaproteobacteria bacterium]